MCPSQEYKLWRWNQRSFIMWPKLGVLQAVELGPAASQHTARITWQMAPLISTCECAKNIRRHVIASRPAWVISSSDRLLILLPASWQSEFNTVKTFDTVAKHAWCWPISSSLRLIELGGGGGARCYPRRLSVLTSRRQSDMGSWESKEAGEANDLLFFKGTAQRTLVQWLAQHLPRQA
jgi:hypothetical protein